MFSKYFENHRVLRALAELTALISSYFVLEAIADRYAGMEYQKILSYVAIAISMFVYLYYISRSRVKNHADKPSSAFGIAFIILLVFVSIMAAYISYDRNWINLNQYPNIPKLKDKGFAQSDSDYSQQIKDIEYMAGKAKVVEYKTHKGNKNGENDEKGDAKI